MASIAHPIPSALAPVLAFINTVDIEDGTDKLAGGPGALSVWLLDEGLVAAPLAATDDDLHLALDLRTGLRALALANNGGFADNEAVARCALAFHHLPLVATVAPLQLQPSVLTAYAADQPVRAALAKLAAGYAVGIATGEWQRIRICPADGCAWGFWDATPQASRRWCTMRVCGNRAKARAFSQRRAAARPGGA